MACVFLVGLAGALGAAVVTRGGAGLDADSVTYLDAGQNLLQGRGLVLSPGLSNQAGPLDLVPLTHHPPLFPVLLATFQWSGVDPLAGARWLNVLLLGANALLVGRMIMRWSGSGLFAALGSLLLIASVDLFRLHVWVLTEPIFITAVLVGLGWLVVDLERPSGRLLAGAAVAIALASLARYAGLAAIAAGALALGLWGPMSRVQRWGRAACFAVAAGAPLLVWLVRNRATEGSLTGKRLVLHGISGSRAREGLDSFSAWLLPDVVPTRIRFAVLVLAALAILAACWWARGRVEDGVESRYQGQMRLGFLVFGAFMLAYAALVLLTISLFDAHVPLDARLLAPLYVATILLAVVGIARLSARVPRLHSLALLTFVLLVGVSLVRTGLWAVGSRLDEMGYASSIWRESTLVAEVKALRDDVRVFSNAPDALYVLTGRSARFVPLKADPFTRQENPRYIDEFGRLERDLCGRSGVVVYFRWLRWRWYLPSEREVIQRLRLVTVVTTREGAMYGGPE